MIHSLNLEEYCIFVLSFIISVSAHAHGKKIEKERPFEMSLKKDATNNRYSFMLLHPQR
jgi:hypothetical protein